MSRPHMYSQYARDREQAPYGPVPSGPRFQQHPPPIPGPSSRANSRASPTMVAVPRELDMKTLNLTREQALELHNHDKEIKRIIQSQVDKSLNQKIKDATFKQAQSLAAKDQEIGGLRMDIHRYRATIASRDEEIETIRQQRASTIAQHLTTNATPIEPGGLAASGLLCEGADFNEWKKRMTPILRARHGSVPAELDVKKLHLSKEQVYELCEHDGGIRNYIDDHFAGQKVAAVKLAVESLEKTWQVQMNAKDIAFAKIAAVQKAVQDTPNKPVKEVWTVAHKARPTAPPRPAGVALHAASLTTLAQKVKSLLPAARPEHSDNIVRAETSQHEQIADINALCHYISPALLDRIPDRVKSNLDLFWAFTSGLARPMRFLELPVAVRNMIYGLTLNGSEDVVYRQLREPLPPLLAVSREVRQEARPVYFSTSMFDYNYTGDLDGMVDAIKTDLGQWLRVVARSELKHLRDLRINLRPSGLGGKKRHILFSFDPAHGLMAQVLGEGQILKKPLQQLVAHVEGMRMTMNLQGEAIGMALVIRPELWTEVALSFGAEELHDRIVKTEE